MGEPEMTAYFYDYCERCSTCTWCSWHGRCLAECVPSDFALGDTFAQLRADLASVRQERDELIAERNAVVDAMREDEYDWRQFCVNHNGFSGPTAKCPTCQEKSHGNR